MKSKTWLSYLVVFFISCASSVCIAKTSSQEENGNKVLRKQHSLLTGNEFQAYVDGVIETAMKDHNIVGLALSVVADSDVKVLKGYGYADVESRTPVDPKMHMFRIGSVTKTFTFTAIMQLVEQGKIDLDADVNDYLTAFKIPEAFDAPVRIKDLLTHRAGFEEVYRGVWVNSPDDFTRLEDWLKNNIPERVFPPGAVTSYSNYGAALAGYIVQQVSGLAYEDYLEAFIFKPLAMTSTTAKQPLSKNHPLNMPMRLQSKVATVYTLEKGARHKEVPFELLQSVPAGSISSTAADMSRYMLAFLNEGELEGARILKRNTVVQMHGRPYPYRPGPDYAHGFRTGKIAGYSTFGHGGATHTSYTDMVMIPELGIGLFISVNGSDLARAHMLVAELILEKIIKEPRPRPETVSMSTEEAKAFAGRYMTTRRAYSSIFKLVNLTHGVSTVEAGGDNSLIITSKGKAKQYRRIGLRSFQQPNGNDVVTFELDTQGRAVRYYSTYGHVAHDRMTLDANPQFFWLSIMLGCIGAVVYLLMSWSHRRKTVSTDYERWAVWRANITSGLVLLCAGLLLISVKFGAMDVFLISRPIAVVSGIATVVALAGGMAILKGRRFTLTGKACFTVFVMLMLNMLVSFYHWNMFSEFY